MAMNDLVARVASSRQLGRRALFRSLQRPAAAAVVLAVGLAANGGLRALPVAADDIEYCDGDPVVFVDLNGTRMGVKVHLGWQKFPGSTALVNQLATRKSLQASYANGMITVSATVVASAALPTIMWLEPLQPGTAPGSASNGTTNAPMTATISA